MPFDLPGSEALVQHRQQRRSLLEVNPVQIADASAMIPGEFGARAPSHRCSAGPRPTGAGAFNTILLKSGR